MTEETFAEFKERARKQYSQLFYDRQGNEMSKEDWVLKLNDEKYKIIRQDYYDIYFISTVWLGLNHRFFMDGKPLIFETMIFMANEKDKDCDDPLNLYQERYSSEEEAIYGHDIALNLCKEQVRIRNSKLLEEETLKDSPQEDQALLP